MDEIVRVSIVAIIAYITLKWVNSPYDIPSATTLTERAKTVCFPLGKMDVSTMDSIYRWVYGILSFAYYEGCYAKVLDAVLAWSHEQDDLNNCVHLGCTQAITQISKAIERVNENPSEFHVPRNKEFDYHNAPWSLLRNDHIDCLSLIKQIDSIMEVK